MKSNNNGLLTEFINDSKELLDFTRCAVVATRYKENQFDFRNYSRKVINMEKRMKADKDDVVTQVFKMAIEKYFDGTNIKDAVNGAMKDIEEEIGVNPRELVIAAIQG
jgi:hypothetical protein